MLAQKGVLVVILTNRAGVLLVDSAEDRKFTAFSDGKMPQNQSRINLHKGMKNPLASIVLA
jgi:hypothetical protein